uniref:flavonol synthase/flavanone 3-hydroxylase-like n=1 Tax=Erigeron canadensis TaxID=72917 RepID=UPI001CB908F5|nr:flavonol synthase/flavanone 3-hydroxylase-like [Erigeron canadensis]
MPEPTIPTVDLSPFFTDGDEAGRRKAKETISEACANYGFFQVVNHGVPLDLMNQSMELSRTFFKYSDEVKRESSSGPDAPLPAGYNKQPKHSPDKNEYVLMFPPESPYNVLPANPPHFRTTLEEMFKYFVKTGQILEGIISECLGLPPNFLQEYNGDRSWDFLVALRYFPASETENNGITEHEDGNLITIVLQEDIGGLEVCKNGEWIPVIPSEGTLVVNLGDVIQVLSNKKFKSATHKVVRPKGRSRHSHAFFYNLHGDKWVEPLPQFTQEIGMKPRYKGFYLKEYQALRLRNKTHPPSNPEDVIRITNYEI